MSVGDEFKKFLLSGSLVTMAIAFVVGLAIVALIGALVDDVIDPLIGAAGGVSFTSIGIVTINGSNLLFGSLLGALLTFIILMLVVFLLIAYPYQRHLDKVAAAAAKAPPTTRICPACANTVPIVATRCGFCTSTLPPVAPGTAAPAVTAVQATTL
jgi:large conductance mechanosensitive channel